MIYIITHGEYSDYSIVAILEAESGQDLNALYFEFKYDTQRPSGYEGLHEWEVKLSDEWGLTRDVTAPNGNSWKSYVYESGLFSHWLTLKHGFKECEYDETNFDF